MSSLARLLDPKSIAIVGVSGDERKHGSRVLTHLQEMGYQGRVWGVNPGLPDHGDVAMYGAIDDLPFPPDLVIAAVPAMTTIDVVTASTGAGAVIVFASGFGETGAPGREMEEALLDAASAANVRLLGPNSAGVIRPDHGLAASFLTCLDRPRGQIKTGPVGLVTQSGGIGSYMHNLAAARDEGLAVSVSTGNEVDIRLGEAIDAVSHLDGVRVVIAIIETVRDGEVFIGAVRAARSRGVEIVACSMGSGHRSRDLVTSHTGALAVPQTILDGVFAALDVTVAETPAEAYEIAALLGRCPSPSGSRAGIITHSGGMAILLSDLAESAGLALDDPSPALGRVVAGSLDHGTAANPLDMGAIIGGPGRFAEVVDRFARSGEYDVVLAVSTAHPPADTDERVESLLELDSPIPLVHLWMAGDQAEEGLARLRATGSAVVEEPRAAVRALAALTRSLEDRAPPDPIAGLLETWDVPLDTGLLATTLDDAMAAADTLGYPVVVKAEARGLAHKTELGAVILDLRSPGEVAEAHRTVVRRATAAGWPDVASRIQRDRSGLEIIVGGLHHESFGPLISVGIGGIFTEVIADVVFAPAPVDVVSAARMINRLRGRRLFDGFRGKPPADIDSLARIVSDVSRGVAGPDISEFEINPLIWDGEAWWGVDWLLEKRPLGSPS